MATPEGTLPDGRGNAFGTSSSLPSVGAEVPHGMPSGLATRQPNIQT
jgi:hypothetical protein